MSQTPTEGFGNPPQLGDAVPPAAQEAAEAELVDGPEPVAATPGSGAPQPVVPVEGAVAPPAAGPPAAGPMQGAAFGTPQATVPGAPAPVGTGGPMGGGMPPGVPPKGGVFSKIGKGTMILFAALVLGVITVAALSMRPGPGPADAGQQQMTSVVDTEVAMYRSDPQGARQRHEKFFKDCQAIRSAFYDFAKKTQISTEKLKQNPFVHHAKKSNDEDQRALAERMRLDNERKEAERRRQEEERKRIEAALVRITIQTILYSDDNPMVLISNHVYRPGETLGMFVVKKINRNSIVLQYGDKTFVKNMD
jgi:hypothetical protein